MKLIVSWTCIRVLVIWLYVIILLCTLKFSFCQFTHVSATRTCKSFVTIVSVSLSSSWWYKFFLEILTLHKFPKKEIYYFHNRLCVAVPMIYNFLFRKFLWKSLFLSWSHDFLQNLSRPRVRSKIRIALRTFHSILGACTKCDTWFSTLYVKSESLPLFTYSWR